MSYNSSMGLGGERLLELDGQQPGPKKKKKFKKCFERVGPGLVRDLSQRNKAENNKGSLLSSSALCACTYICVSITTHRARAA